jgi:hypothetical protein
MSASRFKNALLAISLAAAAASMQNAAASIVISEIDPSGSGTSTYKADWFELTNTGSGAVSISGWKMDDNSNAFGSAVALRGLTSIAAGQSVIFFEDDGTGANDATIQASFKSAWFGSNVPAGLTFGAYGGAGVGLSTSGDAVNIFDSAGAVITRVDFGAAAAGTFDNSAGLNNVTLTTKSVAGINSAFNSLAGRSRRAGSAARCCLSIHQRTRCIGRGAASQARVNALPRPARRASASGFLTYVLPRLGASPPLSSLSSTPDNCRALALTSRYASLRAATS